MFLLLRCEHSTTQQRCPDLLFCALGPCKDNGLHQRAQAGETGTLRVPAGCHSQTGGSVLVGLQLFQGLKKHKSVSAGMSERPAEFPAAGQGSGGT